MPKEKKTKKADEQPPIMQPAGISEDYVRGIHEMKGIGTTFRFDPEFRRFMRDYLYDAVRLCKDIAWSVVEVESGAAPAGYGLGSKQDVLQILPPLIDKLLPDIPTLYRIWLRMKEGYYQKLCDSYVTPKTD